LLRTGCCVYYQNWTGGHSCGPRLFADLTPFFIVFLIPALLKAREAAQGRLLQLVVFTALLCASLFIHSRGARSYEVYGWNSTPENDQVRAWDWRDPQFLRGLDSPKFQHLFRFLGTNQARDWNPFYFCANL